MTLVQSGRLRLDDRVVDHLPGFRFGGASHASKVTIRHLLAQTTGLPEPAGFEVTDCFRSGCPSPAERIGALDDVKPLGPPGMRYAYTSANYLVLAAVVEAVTKRPFGDYLRQAVLGPAGMDGAVTDAVSARRRNLPPGHQLLWGIPSAVADGIDDHGASYGYLGGDLGDLAAFASLQLRRGKTVDGGTVLTSDSVRLMREEGRLQPAGTGTGYGLGWRIGGGLEAPLDTAVWHTGATPGYSAMLFLLPQRNIALVLQQNIYGLLHDGAVMEVGFGAVRLLTGGRPPAAQPSASTYYATVWGGQCPGAGDDPGGRALGPAPAPPGRDRRTSPARLRDGGMVRARRVARCGDGVARGVDDPAAGEDVGTRRLPRALRRGDRRRRHRRPPDHARPACRRALALTTSWRRRRRADLGFLEGRREQRGP
ncbi:serine hydrolase domain-containing protein [Actinomadura sp. NPDC047616]|uniref:serine hydrolase domain-containing protein n=1 Tax=Actinomadura sp. NPDC047616 TaxID=3155914 RepID=UPI00340C5853